MDTNNFFAYFIGYYLGEFGTYQTYWKDEFEIGGLEKEISQQFFETKMQASWNELTDWCTKANISVNKEIIIQERNNPILVFEKDNSARKKIKRDFGSIALRYFDLGELLGGEFLWCMNMDGAKIKTPGLWKMKLDNLLNEDFSQLFSSIPQLKEIVEIIKKPVENITVERFELEEGISRLNAEINNYILSGSTRANTYKVKCIYFSYAWGDKEVKGKESRETIINRLYEILKDKGYSLKRDKMDLGYKGLISEFMQEIGKGSLIIVAISEKYLKSPYCMFELYEIYRNSKLDKQEFTSRIFPIHLEKINLNDPIILDEYYTYWEEKEKAWSNFIQRRMDKIGNEQYAKFSKVRQISTNFGDIASLIIDMNALTPEMLSENNFEKMIEAINSRMNEE